MEKNPDCHFTKLLLHIRNKEPQEVIIEQLNSGDYTFEVLGGNHTRSALQTLGSQHNICVDATVYAGLSDGQALCLGLQHNQLHTTAKPMSFTNYINMFRKIWMTKTANLETPTQAERTEFKKYLSMMLRVPVRFLKYLSPSCCIYHIFKIKSFQTIQQ